MSLQVSKSGSVRFEYIPDSPVKKVFVAGSFNNWEPVQMRKQKDGHYVRKMDLPQGSYEYKFIVDGVWQHDAENDDCRHNEMGTVNSVVSVG